MIRGPTDVPEGMSAYEHHRLALVERALDRVADQRRRNGSTVEADAAARRQIARGRDVSPVEEQLTALHDAAHGKKRKALFPFLWWG
jgi:hypothetical protein